MEDTVIEVHPVESMPAKAPHIPRIGNFSFEVEVQPLFESEQAAHEALLLTFMPYLRRLEVFYDSDLFKERMSDKRVVAEFQKLWQVWRQYVRKPS